MRSKRYAALLAAACIALAGVSVWFLLTGHEGGPVGPPDIGRSLAKSVTSRMEDFRFVEESPDGTRLEVSARLAQLRNRKYRQFRLATGRVLELDAPVFLVYAADGRPTVIKAVSAVVDPVGKSVSFDWAVVEAPDRAVLDAPRLEWRYAGSRLVVVGAYALFRGGGMERGEGAAFDMRLGRVGG